MERSEQLWREAHTNATTWVRRQPDSWTRNHADDLVQDASIAAWCWSHGVLHRERFWAAVQTITRRIRVRKKRARSHVHVSHALVAMAAAREPEAGERHYQIDGARVPEHRARPWLRSALGELKPIDRELLLGFHEGFCCAELAERFHLSLTCVKTRIHRARRRIQLEVETRARIAGALDP